MGYEVGGSTIIGMGDPKEGPDLMGLNTAYVERKNLTSRQMNGANGSKDRSELDQPKIGRLPMFSLNQILMVSPEGHKRSTISPLPSPPPPPANSRSRS